eukprot:scaffold320111_cov30-Tisochrysis_lutea.AAC.4
MGSTSPTLNPAPPPALCLSETCFKSYEAGGGGGNDSLGFSSAFCSSSSRTAAWRTACDAGEWIAKLRAPLLLSIESRRKRSGV